MHVLLDGQFGRGGAGDVDPHRVAQQCFRKLTDLEGMVAENSDDCRSAGKAATIRRMSRMKPRSSIRSASSSTKWLTSFSFSSPVDIKSQMRPGVPTTMSAPAAHPLHLRRTADATEDRDDAASRFAGENMQALFDLQREFACRGKDEGTRGVAVRSRRFACQVLQHRQGKGGSLSVPVWATPSRSRPASSGGIAVA